MLHVQSASRQFVPTDSALRRIRSVRMQSCPLTDGRQMRLVGMAAAFLIAPAVPAAPDARSPTAHLCDHLGGGRTGDSRTPRRPIRWVQG